MTIVEDILELKALKDWMRDHGYQCAFTTTAELKDNRVVHWQHIHVFRARKRVFDVIAPTERLAYKKAHETLSKEAK